MREINIDMLSARLVYKRTYTNFHRTTTSEITIIYTTWWKLLIIQLRFRAAYSALETSIRKRYFDLFSYALPLHSLHNILGIGGGIKLRKMRSQTGPESLLGSWFEWTFFLWASERINNFFVWAIFSNLLVEFRVILFKNSLKTWQR